VPVAVNLSTALYAGFHAGLAIVRRSFCLRGGSSTQSYARTRDWFVTFRQARQLKQVGFAIGGVGIANEIPDVGGDPLANLDVAANRAL